MRRSLLSLAVAAATLIPACTAHQIEVASLPEGAIISEVGSKGEKRKLGKTPFKIDDKSELDSRNLLVELPGHVPMQVLVVYPYSAESKIVVTLTPLTDQWFRDVLSIEYADKVDEILGGLLLVQNALAREGDDARDIIETARKTYGSFSAFHTMIGIYHFRKGDMKAARVALEEAARRNQKNETARMLLNMINGRAAGDGGAAEKEK